MATWPSYMDPEYEFTDQLTQPMKLAGRATAPYTGPDTVYSAYTPDWQPGGTELALLGDDAAADHTLSGPITIQSLSWPSEDGASIGQDIWWEKMHLLPRDIILGNILSTVDTTIDIFNAYRTTSQQWTGFVNNAGAGTEMLSLSLPESFAALQGKQFTYRVTTEGPAQVNTVLEYTFTGTGTVNQPISFIRLVAFPYEPETPIEEELSWLTEVIPGADGTEQRIAWREFPRQEFVYVVQRDQGPERQKLRNRLFDRQELPWGLPVWTEETELTVAAVATDTVLTVARPYISDFRVGQQLMLWQDEDTFETGLITALSPTQITLSSGVVSPWAVGTKVLPMRTAVLASPLPSSRGSVGLAPYTLRFRVTDNETDLAQTNSWSTYNSKVLLDDFNFIDQDVSESDEIPIILLDNEIGRILQVSSQTVSRRTSRKKFISKKV